MEPREHEHLSLHEIERLAGAIPPDVERCPDCQASIAAHQLVRDAIQVSKNVEPQATTGDCPPEEAWRELASGLMTGQRAEEHVAHAARCGRCPALLREALAELGDEPLTAEEQELVGGLRGSTPEGRARLAAELAAEARRAETTAPRRQARAGNPWISAIAAAALVCAVLGGFAYWRHEHSPEVLLARAYASHRTLELRAGDTPYGTLIRERGGNADVMRAPPQFSEAASRIGGTLEKRPDDAGALALKCRLEVLAGNYAAAIEAGTRALEQRPDTVEARIDLASAYFERAEAEQRAIDYGKADELLSEALKRDPENRIALFNRAIVAAKLSLFHEAAADWEHYLKLDANGAWAKEARERKAALERLLREREQRGAVEKPSPAAFLALLERNRETAAGHSEYFLERAQMEWLPAAFPAGEDAAADGDARKALEALAALLEEKHQDGWLRAVLAAKPSGPLRTGMAALARSLRATNSGLPDAGRASAETAMRSFGEAGSRAGELRAGALLLYALQRSARGQACIGTGRALSTRFAGAEDPWDKARIATELSGCVAQTGDLAGAAALAEEASAAAEAHHYPVLGLRARGVLAGYRSDLGYHRQAWDLFVSALNDYWAGSYPPIRADKIYAALGDLAEEAGQIHLASAMSAEDAAAAEASDNRTMEALARVEDGRRAQTTGDDGRSEAELARAQELLRSLPQSPALEFYRVYCGIGLATGTADAPKALAILRDVRGWVTHLDDALTYSDYFRAEAQADERAGLANEAAAATRSEIVAAELALRTVHNSRERQLYSRDLAAAYRRLVQFEWRDKHDPQTAFAIWEWRRGTGLRDGATLAAHPSFASLESRPAGPPAGEAARLAGMLTKETLVSYARLPDGIAAWVGDRRGILPHWLPVGTEELDRLIAQFRRGCADRNSDLERWRACSRRLYDLLIAPISRDLPKGQPLLVELDAELSSIPFAALLDPEGRYFGETQTLSDFPGTAYLRRLREPGTLASSDTAVAVGEPAIASEFASAFSPLPEAADEARAVACRFQNATLLTGAEATRQNLERKLTSAIVFHFAGHSVANADRVSLLLAPGDGKESKRESSSVLNALDVKTDLLKRCSLAVFSACSSSGLEGDGAADPESLVRVFLDAGVPWVIASGWDVDSHATARFMNALYRRLLAGDRAPAAMRDAAREVRRQPETAHPYYWAAFRLYGRT